MKKYTIVAKVIFVALSLLFMFGYDFGRVSAQSGCNTSQACTGWIWCTCGDTDCGGCYIPGGQGGCGTCQNPPTKG